MGFEHTQWWISGWSGTASDRVVTVRLRPLPPMLTNVVLTALQTCEGTEYAVEGPCGFCGGTLSGYDTRSKRFAVIGDDDGDHPLKVNLHRAYCRSCGRILMPEEPFYPGTRLGSPVVDLCRAFSATMSSGLVATRLGQMGVKVDRWSVRAYSRLPYSLPPTIAAFGMNVPVSIISLSSLSVIPGGSCGARGRDVLNACNYPSRNTLIP
ncbi:MAG: hypothetical protein CVV34_04285 [Methanomicrobiales archaeon HGW-Methanomicrobiales-5]|nr:MAG: hypothetical protein CVV34_04285 [Methanomicrobiales archaeon HGW-Methanomicrobiales-5]